MNTALKVTLIIAIVLVVAGLIIMTVALMVSKFNLQKLVAPTLTDSSVPVSAEFTSISIKSDAATVRIARSTDGLCRVDFTDFDDDSITHTVEVGNGVLKAGQNGSKNRNGLNGLSAGAHAPALFCVRKIRRVCDTYRLSAQYHVSGTKFLHPKAPPHD